MPSTGAESIRMHNESMSKALASEALNFAKFPFYALG
jgi:hypothetical protein